MSVNLEKVKNLLGAGLDGAIVATAVGCTESYISQLMADPDFALSVAVLRTEEIVRNQRIDDGYNDLEDKLLDRLRNIIPLMMKPRDILNALHTVNAAKRKNVVGAATGEIEDVKTVKLLLPNAIINFYKVNNNGAMMEVGGKSIAPMPSSFLMKTLEERRESERVQKLPTAVIEQNIPSERIADASSV